MSQSLPRRFAAAASIEYIAVQVVGRFAVGRHGQW